jgi:formamidopyrimidine-DNA glycosylase
MRGAGSPRGRGILERKPMPEIPDLEVVKDFLNERIAGREIVRAEARRPRIARSLAADDFVADVTGHTFGKVPRLGKDLLFPLNPDRVLARGKFLSGIGNAYVDDILWAARVSPFRKRKDLSDEELRKVYDAVPEVLQEAIDVVRERMPPDIHREVRHFLKVHRKASEPCPRCGAIVSEITPNQRITSWCRSCQPGGLIKD